MKYISVCWYTECAFLAQRRIFSHRYLCLLARRSHGCHWTNWTTTWICWAGIWKLSTYQKTGDMLFAWTHCDHCKMETEADAKGILTGRFLFLLRNALWGGLRLSFEIDCEPKFIENQGAFLSAQCFWNHESDMHAMEECIWPCIWQVIHPAFLLSCA